MLSINPSKIRELLRHPLALYVFDVLDSTNTFLKAKARDGEKAVALAVTDCQTGGKGRLGRSFFSPEGGVYFSVLVDSPGIDPGQLTTLAAVCSLRALKSVFGATVQIKWVNDLIMQGRKLGGILCEGILEEGKISKTVIGIGINTSSIAFPKELSDIAVSLSGRAGNDSRERLIAALANDLLDSLPGIPDHMAEYKKNCLTLQKTVRFSLDSVLYTGVARDIDDTGALVVQAGSGLLRIAAGEVSLFKDSNLE